jgi:hypothetical protein
MRSSGATGLPLAVASRSVNCTGWSRAGSRSAVRLATTGDRAATTGMNCGLAGSQNSSAPFPSTRKSMWFKLVPVGRSRTPR